MNKQNHFFPLQFILLAVCSVAVLARPDGRHIPVLQHTEVHDEHGQYALSYVTANGIAAADQGALKHIGNTNVFVRQGSYTYLGPDGVQYTVRYVADENGFRPEGAHFPVAPEPLPVV